MAGRARRARSTVRSMARSVTQKSPAAFQCPRKALSIYSASIRNKVIIHDHLPVSASARSTMRVAFPLPQLSPRAVAHGQRPPDGRRWPSSTWRAKSYCGAFGRSRQQVSGQAAPAAVRVKGPGHWPPPGGISQLHVTSGGAGQRS